MFSINIYPNSNQRDLFYFFSRFFLLLRMGIIVVTNYNQKVNMSFGNSIKTRK